MVTQEKKIAVVTAGSRCSGAAGVVRALAAETAKLNNCVNGVSPRFIGTAMVEQ